jgi:hypothetical protein
LQVAAAKALPEAPRNGSAVAVDIDHLKFVLESLDATI